MIRYPAFTAQPAAVQVRERLLAERPELVEAGIHLLVAQLPDGDLIIGDTHTVRGDADAVPRRAPRRALARGGAAAAGSRAAQRPRALARRLPDD